jgi:hypothetical protein
MVLAASKGRTAFAKAAKRDRQAITLPIRTFIKTPSFTTPPKLLRQGPIAYLKNGSQSKQAKRGLSSMEIVSTMSPLCNSFVVNVPVKNESMLHG